MAEEIRLGSFESMANVNLGSIEVEEIKLGSIFVWKNNVTPYFSVAVNGTNVSSNGTIETPQDAPGPTDTPLQNFTYTSDITVQVTGVQDEDMHFPITATFYEGDFGEDETLTALQTNTINSGQNSTSFTVPKGPQPGGNNAADFIYTDKLFSVVLTDVEEGVSIQYVRVARADVTDQWNSSAWTTTNTGPNYDCSTSTSCSVACSGACFQQQGSQITSGTQTLTRTCRDLDQARTNTYQVNGIQDATQPTEPATTRTITQVVSSSQGSCQGTSSSCTNPDYVADQNTITGSYNTSSTVYSGTCGGVGTCVSDTYECCNGRESGVTTVTKNNTNCANQVISTETVSTNPNVDRLCNTRPNPDYTTPSPSVSCNTAGSQDHIVQAQVSGLIDPFNWRIDYSGTCGDGSSFSASRSHSGWYDDGDDSQSVCLNKGGIASGTGTVSAYYVMCGGGLGQHTASCSY